MVVIAAVAVVIVAGNFLSRPLFRTIAATGLREAFTATALMLVIGIALLMNLVGLSPALGTFLAGVVLANSEFRHELETDIEPFKGLLLGLFFITVGAGVRFGVLLDNTGTKISEFLTIIISLQQSYPCFSKLLRRRISQSLGDEVILCLVSDRGYRVTAGL